MTELDIIDPGAEIENQLRVMASLTALYNSDYYGRLLGPEEVEEASGAVSAMEGTCFAVHNLWVTAIDQVAVELESSAEAELSNRIVDSGTRVLRFLRPAVTYAAHFERECARLADEGLVQPDRSNAAIGARETVTVIADAVERDVSSLQGRISVLLMQQQSELMAIQTDLNKQVQRLTKWTMILTAVVLLVASFAAVVGAVAAL